MGQRVSGEIVRGETAKTPGSPTLLWPNIAVWLLVVVVVGIVADSMLTGSRLSATFIHAAPLLVAAGLWAVFMRLSMVPDFLAGPAGTATIIGICLLLAVASVAAILVHDRTGAIAGLRAWPLLLIAVAWIFLFLHLRFRKRASSLPPTFDAAYEIGEEGLRISNPVVELTLRWSSIHWVKPSGAYWVISGPGNHALPKRLFVDSQAERAFLADMLKHMTPAARAASRQAQSLVTWE